MTWIFVHPSLQYSTSQNPIQSGLINAHDWSNTPPEIIISFNQLPIFCIGWTNDPFNRRPKANRAGCGSIAAAMKRKGRAALQFNKPSLAGQDKKAGSAKSRKKPVVRRPWATPQFEELPKEEREIVLDRVQKEVVAPMRALPAVKAHVVRGVNSVARALERGELGVVVLANNPESLLFGHIPLACRLRGVPICVLHLSSKTLGKLFDLKSLAVFGIRKPLPLSESDAPTTSQRAGESTSDDTHTTGSGGKKDGEVSSELSPADRAKLLSIIEFLQSKASKKAQ